MCAEYAEVVAVVKCLVAPLVGSLSGIVTQQFAHSYTSQCDERHGHSFNRQPQSRQHVND